MWCLWRINSRFLAAGDATVGRLMKPNDDTASYSSQPGYVAYGDDVTGQSAVVPVVVMPTTVAPTSAVVYLCPPGTYRQWMPPSTAVAGPMAPSSAVSTWSQSVIAPCVGDGAHVTDWTTSSVPALPLTHYQQSTVSPSIINHCLIPQTVVSASSSVRQHHDDVIQSLNSTDLSSDTPLVVSTKYALRTYFLISLIRIHTYIHTSLLY